MNRHFEDTRYYLTRAVETACKGVTEELEPLRDRFEERGEDEPEPGRVDQLRADLADLQERAEGEARERLGSYRERRIAPHK